jgi:replicative DNA helicase
MFSGKIEHLILANLLYDEKYTRKVLPFLKKEYFEDHSDKVLFEEISTFVNQYQSLPTVNALQIQAGKRVDLSQDGYSDAVTVLSNLPEDEWDYEWKLNTTEAWCKERAIYLALLESVKIADGKDSKLSRDAIPDILSNALSVSFDDHVGHDYIIDASDRYDFYHRKEEKIPFDLDFFNKITKGGLPSKTLNICLAGTGVGKSLFMCHVAAASLLQGKNVLYITLEMAEERIAERIDANLLNISIRDLETLPKQLYENKINSLSKKTQGKLIIKEYPTASAHSGHFKSLLNELSLKKSFKPDIIFIDYLNICASSRYKGTIVNSYTYVKAIAEELRGMAVEHNVPIVSATQTTRSGYSNTDVDLTDTSESFGLPATADFMFALISTEELEELGQICVKQLKNRYNDPTSNRKFIIGVDRSKMKLYDVDQSAQKDIIDSGQDDYEDETESKFRKKSFVDLKF